MAGLRIWTEWMSGFTLSVLVSATQSSRSKNRIKVFLKNDFTLEFRNAKCIKIDIPTRKTTGPFRVLTLKLH